MKSSRAQKWWIKPWKSTHPTEKSNSDCEELKRGSECTNPSHTAQYNKGKKPSLGSILTTAVANRIVTYQRSTGGWVHSSIIDGYIILSSCWPHYKCHTSFSSSRLNKMQIKGIFSTPTLLTIPIIKRCPIRVLHCRVATLLIILMTALRGRLSRSRSDINSTYHNLSHFWQLFNIFSLLWTSIVRASGR